MAGAPRSEFRVVFDRLQAALRKQAGGALKISKDSAAHFCLSAGPGLKIDRVMPVAWVKIDKNYVSYHFMPVYGCPKLLDALSPKLRARMQGKSCFNFKSV